MNDELGCLTLLMLSLIIILVTALTIDYLNYKSYNKQICTQLYQKTQNYQNCITKDIQKNIKLIKVIDKENL